MGYKRPRRVLKLVFDDPEMEGLEVRAAGLATGELLDMTKLAEIRNKPTDEGIAAAQNLIGRFAKALRSWNYEDDDGQPVPTTLEALLDQDPEFVFGVIGAWMDAIGGVSVPLGKPSSGGEQFPEASIPMDALSSNQPS